ncbi:phosphoglycerate mutase family protein [Enterovibrio sp. ZSDZ35]|uniref:Phosphoglycerate mutase family protein n=1 Tax=Enterovibrio qingdaonensis TaxID=2899818 RepID=A0ABT5QNN1_9GAMM|nr:histidine phosphatase family protein [Enterovibrio sp. ZSDZ35]MDD1782479.1 phosphoglycerate mutase family protein [Enterovibrio sp. ZSDZ35]
MRLYLIRHGYSVANNAKLVTGDKTDPLHQIGLSQAAEVSEWIKNVIPSEKVDLFVTSDWRRANQTAQILFPEATWVVDPALGETNAGSVKNLPLSEFIDLNPRFYHSNDNKYPDGESHAQLNVRVIDWLKDLVEGYQGKTVVAVVHSGPISCILQEVCNVDMSHFPAFLPMNCSVSRVDYSLDSYGALNSRLKYFSACPNKVLSDNC